MTLAQDLPRPRTRIDDIEVLRAFAILFVILWHAGILSPGPSWLIGQILSGGVRLWDGVDLFLVISGFVIGRGLLPLFGQQPRPANVRAHLRAFWTRRAWRLWPASWLWLAIVLLASVCVDLPTSLGTPTQNAWGAISAIGLFANLRFAADAASWHYFGGLFPYWSLSLEEQFYLLLPLVMLAAGRRLTWLLVAGILVQWPLRHGAWLQALRTAALLWGVLLAVLERTPLHRRLEPAWLQRSGWLRACVTAALLGLLARGAHAPGTAPRFEFGNIALISAALVWLASYDRGYICPWAWPKPALLWLGSRSFALYLTHIPGGVLAGSACAWVGRMVPITPRQDTWQRIAADAVVLAVLSEATYRLVEQTFRRHGRWAGHERGEGLLF